MKINNAKEINDLVNGTTFSNFKSTHNNLTNKPNKTKYYPRKNTMESRIIFDYNTNTYKTNNIKKEKGKEVSFKLTGDIKVNALVSAKKNYKDYFIKYVTRDLNGYSINDNQSKEKQFYEKYFEKLN